MRKPISILLMMGLTISAILYGAPILAFVDGIACLIVGSVLCGGLLLAVPFSSLIHAVVVVFTNGDVDEEKGLAAYDVFHRLSTLSYASGIIGMVIGLISMLRNLDDPTAIGPFMAVALLTYVYSVFLGEVFFRAFAADALGRTLAADAPNTVPASESSAGEGVLSLIRKVIGGVILVGCLVLGLLCSGPLSYFLDATSFILVFFFTVMGVFTSFRLKDLATSIIVQFSFRPLNERDALISYQVFRRLSELALGAGVLGTLIGLVQMLQKLDDHTAIGPALAVALCTFFYGVILSELIFQPLAADALTRGDVTRDVGQRGQESRLMGVLAGPFMLLLVFFTMLLAMASFP